MSSIFIRVSFDDLRKFYPFGRVPSILEFEIAVIKFIEQFDSSKFFKDKTAQGNLSHWKLISDELPTQDIYLAKYTSHQTVPSGTLGVFVDAVLELCLPPILEGKINNRGCLPISSITMDELKGTVNSLSFKSHHLRSCYYVTQQQNGSLKVIPHAFYLDAAKLVKRQEEEIGEESFYNDTCANIRAAPLFIIAAASFALSFCYLQSSHHPRREELLGSEKVGLFFAINFLILDLWLFFIAKNTSDRRSELRTIKQAQPLPQDIISNSSRIRLFRSANGDVTTKNVQYAIPLNRVLPAPALPQPPR